MTWGPLFSLLLLGFSRQWAVRPRLKTYWWTTLSNSIWPTLKCPVKISGRLQFQPQVQSVDYIWTLFASCVWQCLPPVTSSRIYSIFRIAALDQAALPVLFWEWRTVVHSYCWPMCGQEVAYVITPPPAPKSIFTWPGSEDLLGRISQLSPDFLSLYSYCPQSHQQWIMESEQLPWLFHRHRCKCIMLRWKTITVL